MGVRLVRLRGKRDTEGMELVFAASLTLAGPALVGEINGDLSCMLRDGCGRSLASVKLSAGFRAKD
jgi:hypothetical protein